MFTQEGELIDSFGSYRPSHDRDTRLAVLKRGNAFSESQLKTPPQQQKLSQDNEEVETPLEDNDDLNDLAPQNESSPRKRFSEPAVIQELDIQAEPEKTRTKVRKSFFRRMDPLERLKKSIDKLSENDLENQQKKQPILFRILDKSFNCYHSIHSWIRAFIFLLTIFIFSTVLVIFIWSLLHRNIYKDSVLSNQPSEMHRLICYMKSTYNWTYELLTRRSRQLKEKEFEFEQLKKNNENLLQQIEQIKKKSEQAEELFKRNLELRKVKRHARPNAGNLISSSMGGKIVKTSTPYDPLAHTPKIPFSVNPRKFVDWLVKGVLKVGSLELEDALIVLSPTEIHEGECFALNGSKGEITAQLSARKAINAISIGHIPKSAHYDQDTAPGEFEAECVCRSQADDEDFNLDGTTIKESCANKNYKKPENSTQFAVNMQTKQNSLEYSQTIVTGTYSAKEGKYQTFHRDDYAETAILCDEMRFVFYSNAGNKNYTCIYRLGAYKLNPNKLNEDSPQ